MPTRSSANSAAPMTSESVPPPTFSGPDCISAKALSIEQISFGGSGDDFYGSRADEAHDEHAIAGGERPLARDGLELDGALLQRELHLPLAVADGRDGDVDRAQE